MSQQTDGLATVDGVLETGIIDNELAEILKTTALPSLDTSSISALKAQVEQFSKMAQSLTKPPPPGLEELDASISARDSYEIPIRIYRPTLDPGDSTIPKRPLLVMFHGGGFCLGDLSEETANCRMFVQEFNAIAISVGYRLAPEFPFPIGMNDAWDVLKYVAHNASNFGADLSAGFLVGGVSAGGSIAAVMSCLAVEENLNPPFTGVYSSIPAILPPHLVPEKYKPLYISGEQNKYAPLMSDALVECFREGYKPDLDSKLVSPFNYDEAVLRQLPKTYIQVCGLDRFRDQGLIYERYLRDDMGVSTRLDMYTGMPHAFWGAFQSHILTQQQKTDTLEGLRWLLGT